MTDRELLQAHARGESATAFATLVSRHVDLVYSAAQRQVRSSHLAEEIAQSVFIELHRSAAKIPPRQPLAAWLYVATRRNAIDAIRREARRAVRETTAAELAAMKTPSDSWAKIADTIDDAMESLSESERSAIVLRYFQNLSLREVGAALGTSDDAAQKRESRARTAPHFPSSPRGRSHCGRSRERFVGTRDASGTDRAWRDHLDCGRSKRCH
jgi:RNA polymerase sigma factor (sigma-70 family)